MAEDTLFDKIVRGEIPAHVVWEDDEHLAFLTPFPNTPGFTVVIPKANVGDYVFAITDEQYHRLLAATRKVAGALERGLGVTRVAMVFEGTGVAYVHAKLIPLHGPLADQTDVWSKSVAFNEEYVGHLTTEEGPRMSDQELDAIQRRITRADLAPD